MRTYLTPWLLAAVVAVVALSGCASPLELASRKETVYAVTDQAELIRFNAGRPQVILERKPLLGLARGEQLVGIDFRVARGVLYGLTSGGRLCTIDLATAALVPVTDGAAKAAESSRVALSGKRFAFDFNPAVDRVRVMSDAGQNLRLHPQTGAVVAADPAPAYAAEDPAFGKLPKIVAAAYTYNKQDEKLSTNFAIDAALGTLVIQGSRESVSPVVSPNTGQLFTIGTLGLGPIEDASFDIADIDNTALASLRVGGRTQLYVLDLTNGRARLLGLVDAGRALWGMAIAP
jgi:hypothetical protein